MGFLVHLYVGYVCVILYATG